MERSIIHLNVADFAVAVERALDRRLAGRPVVIAPAGAARATVYDMSEEAYRSGVRKGMALAQALRRCRGARVVAPRPDRYAAAMHRLLERTRPYSPRIEAGEDDGHLFIDATGTARLFGPPQDLARRLARSVREELGPPPVWSLAANKLVAKAASRIVKPEGECIVPAGGEAAFLAELPLALVPGIEGEDLARLREFHLRRAGEVAALGLAELEAVFGGRAPFLYEAVRGIDPSPVLPAGEKPPRIAAAHAFATDTNDAAALLAALRGLAEKAGRELRRRRRAAQRVAVALEYADGGRVRRQVAARPATANDFTLFALARSALGLAWGRRVRVRRLALACDRLVFPPAQLALFDDDRRRAERGERLVAALDRIRERFGEEALRRAGAG